LNTDGVQPSHYPDWLIDFARFDISLSVGGSDFSSYDIRMQVVKFQSLKYQYIFAGHSFDEDIKHIRQRFRDHTVVSLLLLAPENQPPNMDRIWPDRNGNMWEQSAFRLGRIKRWVPSEGTGWTYHDDEMSQILRARDAQLAAHLDWLAEVKDKRGMKRKIEDDMDV
jgi:hypothetical protein